MATQQFKILYTFTSTRADGDAYTRTLTVKAKTAQDALGAIARIEGFRAFGARFNDNCVDWELAR